MTAPAHGEPLIEDERDELREALALYEDWLGDFIHDDVDLAERLGRVSAVRTKLGLPDLPPDPTTET